ncbi:MAG TPA: 50S ribosomal protein L13 [Dehalococcoidia bacterium]|nr:50S ribosomal protein L13 [Dehalococcoidia bacterium]
MKTYSTTRTEVRRTWHVLDASNIPLGRLATHAASLIRGKHKVTYAPHLDTGDYVVVINAEKVALSGQKLEQKKYYSHSQYPGGLKIRSVREQIERNPARVVEKAVFGMLPHNRLGRSLHGHLKVYVGPEHPHAAQVNGPAQPALSQPPPPDRARAKKAAAKPAATASATAPAAMAAPLTQAPSAQLPAAEEPAAELPAGEEPVAELAAPEEAAEAPATEENATAHNAEEADRS